ncbi:putative 3-(3-hydroxy-phenyl)propionate hydroxylase [Rosellinia necatrix]|uniref:Putative 3-(3-hydroxy-phenyl)propionate hydroxylase n=1 Tax=Rosellinia necatrix TaxID=77044 RepID=A0A1S7ULZ9_ROSNE|nr:putative 3-(3-hydroxy-phenyl)propionate hydroxylase [Rosellinia necatrix]
MAENGSLVDVLVVGAGPVGLVTAYQLAKFGGVSVRIIEKNVKSVQDAYGRAITLFPRTSELLDQLGLADELLQEAFACRETVAYSSRGEEVYGRGWSFMNDMKDTVFDFALVLRQKYQEEIFRNALERYGVEVEAPIELIDVNIDNTASPTGHAVTAAIRNNEDKSTKAIRCRRLVGADGGRSSVRHLLEIPFEGSTSEDKWVRIDGHVKTNLPRPRTYCSIESPTHGNVLWVGLDRGATRIGYAFTDDRAKAYAEFDEQAAVTEAIAAVKPFTLEFENVDWWTIYTVGQRIAKRFSIDDRVFLVGDACHTHSSGAAQGMNTGIHDAVNLGWKLSLVLRGLASPTLLNTYESERRPHIQKLIQYDADISRLMTNRLPENWQGDPNADTHEVLGQIMDEAGAFSSGLGISYEPVADNPIMVVGGLPGPLRTGMRAPDIPLLMPGTFERTRLARVIPNTGCFHVIFFIADNPHTLSSNDFQAVRQSRVLKNHNISCSVAYLTILPRKAPSVYGSLGRAYFHIEDQTGYQRYGVDPNRGGAVVIRPDGWISALLPANNSVVYELESLFRGILLDPLEK